MSQVLAALILLAFPAFIALLRRYPHQRLKAFVAVGAIPLLSNLPLIGFIYGWSSWSGVTRGFGISLIVMLSLALIVTRRRISGTLPFWSIISFYGFALFISIFSANVWLATVFVWWQFLCMLIVFAAVGGEGHWPAVRNSILAGFALGLIYQGAFVVSQKIGGVTQAAGTMGHQNILGLVVELTALPLIAAALGGDRRKLILAGIAAALICIAGSGSRGTMGIAGGAIVLLTLASLIRHSTPRKWRVVAGGAIALAITVPIAIGTLNARFGGTSFVGGDDERKMFESAARAMAGNHPFGVGANHYVFISNRDGYADRAGIPWQMADRSVPVHNAYLLARAETGWIGEFALILLLVIPLLTALRLAFRDRTSAGGEVLLGCGVAIIANMIHNTYEFAVHTFAVQPLLFINLGLIASTWRAETLIALKRGKARRRNANFEQPSEQDRPVAVGRQLNDRVQPKT